MMHDKDFLTVSELNQYVQQVIRAGFPNGLWVCGEIQGYNRNKTKRHIFFDLCEKDLQTSEAVAKIGLVIFANRKESLEKTLAESGDPFELKDDIEVKFFCKVDFYPPHGAMRLIVEGLDPAYTLGKMAVEKQRLIALLKKNGVLDKNKALAFPELPLRIGLITSYDSAAYNDFLSELQMSGFGFQVYYNNTLMQGKSAEQDIVRSLREMCTLASCLDVLVITRGGGSISDLSCFDSQVIAEAIAQSPIPVLSGIGHEIDLTITDLAAYAYQKTPTATAQFLVARVEGALASLEQITQRLFRYVDETLGSVRQALRETAFDLQQVSERLLRIYDRQMILVQEAMLKIPFTVLADQSERIEQGKENLQSALGQRFKQEKKHLEHCRRFITMADPISVCRRGFTISRAADGALLRTAADVRPDMEMITHFSDGTIESEVKKINSRRG